MYLQAAPGLMQTIRQEAGTQNIIYAVTIVKPGNTQEITAINQTVNKAIPVLYVSIQAKYGLTQHTLTLYIVAVAHLSCSRLQR